VELDQISVFILESWQKFCFCRRFPPECFSCCRASTT